MRIFGVGTYGARYALAGAIAFGGFGLSSVSHAAPVELVLGGGSTPATLTGIGAAISISDYTTAAVASFVGPTGTPGITAMPSNGTFDYAFTFTVSSGSPSIEAGGISSNVDLSKMLVADVSNGHGGYSIGTVAIAPTSTYTPPSSANPTVFTYAGLSAGTYTLELSGALAGGSSVGSVTAFVTTVPVPASLPMFGAGLAGLAGVGWLRSRRSSAV